MTNMAPFLIRLTSSCVAASVAVAMPAVAQQMGSDSAIPASQAAPNPQMVGAGADASYRVGPGDLLSITVYRSPDMGGAIRVNTDGSLVFPSVGTIQVANMTAAEVAAAIAAQLRSKGILLRPDVNVLVTEVRAHVVDVMGQVGHPGAIPLDRDGMTLAAVLARSGATFATGSGVVTVMSPHGTREQFLIVDLLSGKRDRPARSGETLVVQSAAAFYVSGEVNKAGQYPVEPNLTVGQALAMGGGITPRGARGRTRLTRTEQDGKVTVIDNPKDYVPVMPGDLINVRQRVF